MTWFFANPVFKTPGINKLSDIKKQLDFCTIRLFILRLGFLLLNDFIITFFLCMLRILFIHLGWAPCFGLGVPFLPALLGLNFFFSFF